jgi:hypothetical protein
MLLTILIFVPLDGIFIVSALSTYNITSNKDKILKISALSDTITDLIISLIIFILYDKKILLNYFTESLRRTSKPSSRIILKSQAVVSIPLVGGILIISLTYNGLDNIIPVIFDYVSTKALDYLPEIKNIPRIDIPTHGFEGISLYLNEINANTINGFSINNRPHLLTSPYLKICKIIYFILYYIPFIGGSIVLM